MQNSGQPHKNQITQSCNPNPTQAAGPSSAPSVPFPNEHHCLRLARLPCPLARLEFTQLLPARSWIFGWLQRAEGNPTLPKPFFKSHHLELRPGSGFFKLFISRGWWKMLCWNEALEVPTKDGALGGVRMLTHILVTDDLAGLACKRYRGCYRLFAINT